MDICPDSTGDRLHPTSNIQQMIRPFMSFDSNMRWDVEPLDLVAKQVRQLQDSAPQVGGGGQCHKLVRGVGRQ